MMTSLSMSPSFNATNHNTSHSAAASDCSPAVKHVSLAVCLSLVFLVGLCLNCFSLFVFCSRIREWNAGTVLQFNLALSDSLATPATIMVAVYFAKNSWPFGWFMCQVKIALLSTHFYGSILFLMLISIHRYVMVVHFNRHSLMKQKAFVKKLCGGIWTLLLMNGVIFASLLPSSSTEDHSTQCLSIFQKEHTVTLFAINFLLFAVGFLLPFSVSAACYVRLARSVSQISTNTGHGSAVKSKSLRMIGICLVIFGLCFLPMNIIRTVGVVMKMFHSDRCDALQRLEIAYYASWVLAGVNGCLDPLIYFFGTRNFRKTLSKSLRYKVDDTIDKKSESETVSHTNKRILVVDQTQ
ncbi:P2Y purinoceptor 2 [Engraulis encrasicolus]|uniref:P2Y purinoceptor 2 n=1 Tax=Engraulis encrasicolus TaxID=184585 RepID=UPI002FD2B869